MGKFFGNRGKIVRRFGQNLFGNIKFDRILSRRPNAPGVHGAARARKKSSEYGRQLLEKQKLKIAYGLKEKQFRLAFKEAARRGGITGKNLLCILESRLDNVIYRMGWAPTRSAARQLVSHGHLKVNGRRVNIASFEVGQNMVVSIKDSERSKKLVKTNIELSRHEIADWLDVDNNALQTKVIRVPISDDIVSIADEQMIVELYSK